jgi:hypothetical protein
MASCPRELAVENAKIIAMLPVEEWIDEARAGTDLQLMRLLRALLEVKRLMEGWNNNR